LITLVIIGVIAAITVPTLMNKTNNQEYVSRLKKAYSTLAQVTNQIIAEEGSPKCSSATSNDCWGSDADEFYQQYKKRLNNAKECGESAGCVDKTVTGLDGSNWGTMGVRTDYRTLVLSDGTQVIIDYDSPTCSYAAYGGTRMYCTWFWIDVNGQRKPNKIGRDIFGFALKEQGLYPGGCDYAYCVGTQGHGCACKVLREGAMNY